MARLKEIYKKEVVPALIQQFGYKSTMQVPRLTKIVLNMGVGEAVADKKILENAVGDMTKLSGQKPVITKARKSIAVWKIRTGYSIGWCRSRCRASAISAVYPDDPSTAAVTSTSASRSRSFFRKSSTTRSTRCEEIGRASCRER